MDDSGTHIENPKAYEKKDVDIRWATVIGIGSVLLFAVIMIALLSYFATTREAIYQDQVLEQVPAEVIEFRRVQDSVLNSYELVDSDSGTYRIPIDRAMKLISDEVDGTVTGN